MTTTTTKCAYGGNNQKLCSNETCICCFNKSFASSSKIKFWSNKNPKNPRNIFKSSKVAFIFDCDVCGHEFSKPLDAIKKNSGCGFCGNRQLCSKKTCIICHEKSFASSEKAIYWSEKNKKIPRNVFKATADIIIFNCNVCEHEFSSSLNHVTSHGNWCGYCSNTILCTKKTCHICHEKSVASLEKAKSWSEKNEKLPRNVFKTSNDTFIFNCGVCNHEFSQQLNIGNDSWCPYCAFHKLCSKENCKFCFDKSFASHEKNIFWSIKNNENPRNVRKYSQKIFIFNCNECKNEYMAALYNVSNGRWCNCTKNKTETILCNWLKEHYNIIPQANFAWCKNDITNKRFRFDVSIDNEIIIELDGDQHIKDMPYWKSKCADVQKRDIYKMNCANEHGYSVIRIRQMDIYENKIDWRSELARCIKLLKSKKKIPECAKFFEDDQKMKDYYENYDWITNIFIMNDNLSDNCMFNVTNPLQIIPTLIKKYKRKRKNIKR